MALTEEQKKTLSELVAHIKDDGERKVFSKIFEEVEPIRGGFLRQPEFDRVINLTKAELKTEREARAKADSDIARMQKWWDDTTGYLKWNPEKKSFGRLEEAEAKAKDLEEKLKKAVEDAAKGADMDPELVKQLVADQLKGMPIPSEEKMKEMVQTAARVIADEERKAFLDKTLPNVVQYMITASDLPWKYYHEFNKPFDRAAYVEFANSEDIKKRFGGDQEKVYDEFVKTARADAEKAKTEAASKAEEEKLKKLQEQWEKDFRSKMSVPGTGSINPPPLGTSVQEMFKSGKSADAVLAAKDDKPATSPSDMQHIREGSMEAIAELAKIA